MQEFLEHMDPREFSKSSGKKSGAKANSPLKVVVEDPDE